MEIFYHVMFFIIGAVMGSFFHVVATRLSCDESIVFPGSHCPKCNHYLKWYENIPIISYLILRGKCKNCHSKIPLSYLVVEIVTGLLYAACYHSFHFSFQFIVALVFVSALVTVIVSDIEYMIILDEVLIFSTLLLALLYVFGSGLESAAYHIYSGVGAFLAMYVIKWIGDKAFGRESLGGGDIKLMFLFGMVLGLPMAIVTIFLATFIAFPIALLILFSDKENIIPFGPFLSMAAILVMVSKLGLDDILTFLMK